MLVGLVYKGSRTKAAHIDICRRTKTPDEGTMRRHSKGLNPQLSLSQWLTFPIPRLHHNWVMEPRCVLGQVVWLSRYRNNDPCRSFLGTARLFSGPPPPRILLILSSTLWYLYIFQSTPSPFSFPPSKTFQQYYQPFKAYNGHHHHPYLKAYDHHLQPT